MINNFTKKDYIYYYKFNYLWFFNTGLVGIKLSTYVNLSSPTMAKIVTQIFKIKLNVLLLIKINI